MLKFNINKQYQLFLMPAVATSASIILVIFILFPQVQKVLSGLSENQLLKQRITVLEQKAVALSSINITAFNQSLKKAFLALPPDRDIPTSVTQVQILASNNGLQIINMTVSGNDAVSTQINNYQIRLEVSGDIASVKNFINDLAKAPRVMSVASLSVTSSKSSSIFNIGILLQSYYQGDQATLGGLDQPITELTIKEQQILSQLDEAVKLIPLTQVDNLPAPQGKLNPFE